MAMTTNNPVEVDLVATVKAVRAQEKAEPTDATQMLKVLKKRAVFGHRLARHLREILVTNPTISDDGGRNLGAKL